MGDPIGLCYDLNTIQIEETKIRKKKYIYIYIYIYI
jgi:hypothetical protein